MESIKRKLLLLKPKPQGKGSAVLKILSLRNSISIDLNAQNLPDCICSLYLWDSKGKEYCAGNIEGGQLTAKLSLPSFDNVAAAAIIEEPGGAFLLKTDYDWEAAATAFRLSRLQSGEHEKQQQSDSIYIDKEYENTYNSDSLQEPNTVFESQADYKDERELNQICGNCPHVIRQDKINPFPSVFPQSEWVKISYPGPAGWWHYISGKILRGNKVIAKVLGVPGEYGMAPPIWLEGFGTYMRCNLPDAHGYWLMFQDAQTGEVLDMALSPLDE